MLVQLFQREQMYVLESKCARIHAHQETGLVQRARPDEPFRRWNQKQDEYVRMSYYDHSCYIFSECPSSALNGNSLNMFDMENIYSSG